MSFSSSLCDHSSSSSSSHSLLNPHTFLPIDRLSRRRRPHGDDRLHRHRRMEVGPDLCQRKIDPIHSFPNAPNFIGTDGSIKMGQKELKRIAPALAENPLNLPNFGVPYSLNRHKRWHLTELNTAQLNAPEVQSNDLRVSLVWQKANPLRKGTVNGRLERFWPGSIGRFGEDEVAKFSTFDAEMEICRLPKSARGANSTAQLMQKGPKPKKRACRRAQSAVTEDDDTMERWLDLFQPRDYSAVNPTPTCSAWTATENASAPPVHNYYTFRTQSASRHQLNSGWQNKSMGKALSKAEMREGGRWTEGWQGDAKWEALSRRQIGLLCLQNGVSPVVQKRRGVPCAKGGERFAVEADFGEYFQFLERVDEDESGERNEFEEDELKMELDEGSGREEKQRTEGRKPLQIGDCLIGSNGSRGRKRSAKTKRTNWRCEMREMHGQPVEILREEDENEEANSLVTAFMSEEEMGEREEDRLCQLTPDQVGTVEANIAQFVPLDDDRNGLLPSGTSILQCRSDAEMGHISEVIPSGALLIIRRNSTMEKYFLNPAICADRTAVDRLPPNAQQKPINTPSIASSSKIPSESSFLIDLLPNINNKKAPFWLIKNEPFFCDTETDEEAVRLLFSEFEQKMDDGQQSQPPNELISPMPCRSSLALCADKSADASPTFCGVCFAECSAFDSFALRRCEPFASHTFCDNCWRQHIVHSLDKGRLPIGCMAPRCPSVVRPSVVLLVVGQLIAQRYCQQLAKRRRLCRDFVTCAQCDGTFRLHMNWHRLSSLRHTSQPLVTKCAHCDEFVCCRCAQRQHLPLSCEERQLYELILRSHGHSLRSLLLSTDSVGRRANGVRCDNCNNLVQKNNGCDHIICFCGYEFCWRCGGDWKRHRNCAGNGRINVPLFDLVFTNTANGRKLTKSPEKFFSECAELRAMRHPKGRKIFKQMDKIFANDRLGGRKWAEKYLQVSEFVELCLAKRLISGKKSDDFSAAADRLRFIFCSVPFIAKMDGEGTRLTSREMVEQNYEQIKAISRRIVQMMGTK